ncbi:MAG TPA: hypothetical protein VG368_07285 [Acidimicrobiales bacterium]|nr:hypothetical protein [Acidimicrobiales bacterium]
MSEPLSNDPVIAAIDELSSAVRANVEDERVLNRNLRSMRSRRMRGSSARQLLTNEVSPETLTVLGRLLSRLGRASGIFRRALARDLLAEGQSVTSIARLFGVTHQRTSALLRQGRDDLESSGADGESE